MEFYRLQETDFVFKGTKYKKYYVLVFKNEKEEDKIDIYDSDQKKQHNEELSDIVNKDDDWREKLLSIR